MSSSLLSWLTNRDDIPHTAADVGSAEDAHEKIRRVHSKGQGSDSDNLLLESVCALVRVGLIPAGLVSVLDGYADTRLDSVDNDNPPVSSNAAIYPSKKSDDAPYSVPEEKLRAAIQIPESFSYGKNGKKPVILVPGTGVPAGLTYHFSFGKLAEAVPEADVLWVNIPRATLDDAQKNAEYVAYAINYISARSATSNVSVLAWSQGALNAQWALKYWPSTRDIVEDLILMSPDFHGSASRELVCPLLDPIACAPSIWQQGYGSDFIRTLRADGGDSAYVPTTSIYSTTDEFVQPMSGDNASALLSNAHHAGVTNNHLQDICSGQVAGGIYTHEGVLYNPVSWALAVDALTHDGPGNVSRIDLDAACQRFLAPQLELDDLLGTEGLLLVSTVELLVYQPKMVHEPEIAGYA